MDRRLDRAWEVPLTTVVGPAGAGKTTAASHLAQRGGGQVVWYRAHPVDGVEDVFAGHLARAVERTTGRETPGADLASLALHAEQSARPLLLIVDEFDAVIGTPTEAAFDEVLADVAPSLHFMTLSRHRPSLNLTRLRLGAGIEHVGPDELRFRSWEIDHLFRQLYDRPLGHDEVTELERRTGGWVAALHLFHVATSAMPAGDRRQAIAFVGRRNGPDWDFLADNVLAAVPDDLHLFLLETAPLERLTAALCDDLLGERSSAARLAELERLQLVTASLEAPGTYRSHEVLRAHLDTLLVEWDGHDALLKRYREAAETLERHGYFAEALRAYCRGEDWSSSARLLGARGADVADRPGHWLGGLPTAMVHSDPWLLLAIARHVRAEGRLQQAIAAYQRVEATALTSMPVSIARRERLLLSSLLDSAGVASLSWVGALRRALTDEPLAAVDGLADRTPHDVLAAGVGRLVAGDVARAETLLRRARDDPDASPTLSLAAAVAHLVAAYLAGHADPFVADDLERTATTLDVPFLVRLSRAAGGMVTGATELIGGVVLDCDRAGDTAGAAGAAVLGAIASIWGPAEQNDLAHDALARCRQLGLRPLEVWVQVAMALADPNPAARAAVAAKAESAARRRSMRALQDLAGIAARSTSGPDELAPREVAAVLVEHGMAVPAAIVTDRAGALDTSPRLTIRCLGHFAVECRGEELDTSTLRPRARAVLRMLAAHPSSGVHRDVLCSELWPGDDDTAAIRKLQVAISSIRRVIEVDGESQLVRRRGDVYVLDADAGAVSSDVQAFVAAATQSRVLFGRGDVEAGEAALRTAVELYRGELLPEDGAAEWVVPIRQRMQATATEVATALTALLLDTSRPSDAVGIAQWGLAVDRYSDPLWRLLLAALEADGDLAGRARAQQRYDQTLDELGIVPTDRPRGE